MYLDYPNKQTESEIFNSIIDVDLTPIMITDNENLLFEADNLIALKQLITKYNLAEKIDLIYIDPPFATNNIFTLTNERANTISKNSNGKLAYTDTLKGNDFIEFLRKRFVLLKMLLSEQGSIYVHIDYKIGHYVKIIMDEVFGIDNFRNDITRIKCNPKNFKRKAYGNIKDMILFYSKTKNNIWHEPLDDYSEVDKLKLFPKVDINGKRYTTIPLHAPGETKNGVTSNLFKGIKPPPGRHWRTDVTILEQWNKQGLIEWSNNGNPRKKIYLDQQKGKRKQDIWEFKDPQYPNYPTQKNANLLDLIIKTSSNENSYVLDCFAGSGTTLQVAQLNNRKWIGIDKSKEAIKTIVEKISNTNKKLHLTEKELQLFSNINN